MNDAVKQSMTNTSTWTRGLYMVLFAFIYSLTEAVVVFICLFQFIFSLARGETNDRLLSFSKEICEFMLQILQYETFNTEYKPFPFNPWPEINQAEVSDNNETTTEKTDNEVENLEAEEAIEGEVISASDQEEEEK
ncbi:MAG: DUF4389 domain-containing protein [Gammaproteobacteria bacterium]|jgi:hypothetical protein|nr:DUF4389 domain-containing protein [Gammaproteobacteria bacterium]MBT5202034.1 DUF4389 domain-containing protein [Gammaproteobacteria bacterium]MBT5602509.1 DUF4389 domain-containing protein [Gammaproteobacteria bacterium]MBT6244306.1 DUF4389 domain-containing protein [Gammaproteobacteria bacterium]